MLYDKWLLFVKIATLVLSFVLCILIAQVLTRNDTEKLLTKGNRNYFQHSRSKPVALRLSSSTHYQLEDTSISSAEFAALLPLGGHTVHIDNDRGEPEVYTVTLFHQMKCLGIMRAYYVTEKPVNKPLSPVIRHCLNYLKQTVLCRPSLGLESIQAPDGHAVRSYEAVCRDWSAVYDEAVRNQEVYMAQRGRDL